MKICNPKSCVVVVRSAFFVETVESIYMRLNVKAKFR